MRAPRVPSSREETFIPSRTFLVLSDYEIWSFNSVIAGSSLIPDDFLSDYMPVLQPVMVIEDNYKSGVEAVPTSASVLVAHAGRYG